MLCFLFCFTLRPFTVIGANAEKENLMWGGGVVSHFSLAEVRVNAI